MDIMVYPKIASAIVTLALVIVPTWVFLQNKRAPASRELHSPGIYGCAIAGAAAAAYGIGLPLGIAVACSSPDAGNLCGLAGFFFYGPIFAATAAIVAPLILWVIAKRSPKAKHASNPAD